MHNYNLVKLIEGVILLVDLPMLHMILTLILTLIQLETQVIVLRNLGINAILCIYFIYTITLINFQQGVVMSRQMYATIISF